MDWWNINCRSIFLYCLEGKKIKNYKKEVFIKNIKGDFGKGLVIGISSILYGTFRFFDVLKKPMLFLDIFMLLIFIYAIYLVKFKYKE